MMRSHTNIDCRYIIRVSELMKISELPRPSKRNVLIGDDEILPIISIGV